MNLLNMNTLKVSSLAIVFTLLLGCSQIQWQRAPLMITNDICSPIDPVILPPIDEDGYARFDRDDREALLEYFIRVEQCLESIQ